MIRSIVVEQVGRHQPHMTQQQFEKLKDLTVKMISESLGDCKHVQKDSSGKQVLAWGADGTLIAETLIGTDDDPYNSFAATFTHRTGSGVTESRVVRFNFTRNQLRWVAATLQMLKSVGIVSLDQVEFTDSSLGKMVSQQIFSNELPAIGVDGHVQGRSLELLEKIVSLSSMIPDEVLAHTKAAFSEIKLSGRSGWKEVEYVTLMIASAACATEAEVILKRL